MPIAMPSPKGTNHANLYVTGQVAELLAYDSKHGLDDGKLLTALRAKFKTPAQALKALGLDEAALKKEPNGYDDDLMKALVAIADALDRGDVESARYQIGSLLSGRPEEDPAEDDDQPSKFEGRPQRGAQAMDSFNKRFPNAARVGRL